MLLEYDGAIVALDKVVDSSKELCVSCSRCNVNMGGLVSGAVGPLVTGSVGSGVLEGFTLNSLLKT